MSDVKAEEMVDQLRDQFAEQIRGLSREIPAHQALQMADSLCTVQLAAMAGLRVSYRAAPKIDADAVAEDWMRGLTISEITSKYGISRTAAYKHHPNRRTRRAANG